MHPIIQAEVDEFRKREQRKENLKTGCAICGSKEDHGVDSNFTHQYDNGADVKVFSDESFLSAALHRAVEKAGKEMVKDEEDFIQSIIDVDKTPRYGYSSKDRDLNNKRERAGDGARWLTPTELAIKHRSLALSKLDTIINFKE